MKKLTLTLLAAAMAGMLASASAAQPQADQNNNDNSAPPAAADQPATPPNPDAAGGPPGMNGATATDQSMPADATAASDTAPAGTAAAPTDAPATPANADNSGDNTAGTGVIIPGRSKHGHQDVSSDFVPPSDTGTNVDQLRLDFRNAPLEMVLNYLSDAAGFIIVLDTRVNGNVSVISAHPMTRDEAVDLLNSVLNKNGYAAIRDGRTLTIVDKNDAKTRNIPVISGNDPSRIPNNAEIVTQIIPVRFVDARQLVSDLTSFVSPQATVVANDAGNSIVITDTQQNIKHLTQIIRAIDDSAEAETEIHVFPLKYASPVDVAAELGNVFPSSTSGSGNAQSPIRFGGGGFGGGGGLARFFGGGGGGNFGGGGGGGGGGGAGNSSQDRIRKQTQVTAVADSRIQAVIVTAPKDLMGEIADMMTQLDVPSDRDQGVYVFQMKNGDPQAAVTVLQNMFQSSSARGGSSSSSSSSSALQQRTINNNTSSTSTSSGTSSFGTVGGRAGGGAQY